MSMRLGLCLLLTVLCLPLTANAQTDLASLREAWTACSKKMTESREALDAGDVTPGLADEYRDLVDEANDLIFAMRKQAVVELKDDPGNGQVIRTLLGIMVHDAQEDRDAEVLKAGEALIEARINPKYFEQAANIERLELSQKQVFEELSARYKDAIADDLPRVKLETSAGDVVLELYEDQAPNTVRNFVSLVESGFYENKLFHRVIEDFVAQGGGFETEGIGSGGPGYEIECECRTPDARRNFSGTISMAHAGRDTGGSQFFLNFKHNDSLDRRHTVFGRVIEGMDVLDQIERTELTINGMERPIEQAKPDKIVSAEVLRKRDHSYRVRKKGEAALPEEPVKEDKEEKEEEKSADKETEAESEKATDEPDADSEMKEEQKSAEDADPADADTEEDSPETESAEEETDAEPEDSEPMPEAEADPEPETSDAETPASEPESDTDDGDSDADVDSEDDDAGDDDPKDDDAGDDDPEDDDAS